MTAMALQTTIELLVVTRLATHTAVVAGKVWGT